MQRKLENAEADADILYDKQYTDTDSSGMFR